MEGLVRCLRASVRPDETSAALVAVLDGPASRVGPEGVESFVSLVAAHGAAASAGRAHARRTLVLAGAVEPARYRAECPNVVVVDLRSDPHGWVRDARAGSGVARGGGDGSAEGAWRIASHDLADVGALAAASAPTSARSWLAILHAPSALPSPPPRATPLPARASLTHPCGSERRSTTTTFGHSARYLAGSTAPARTSVRRACALPADAAAPCAATSETNDSTPSGPTRDAGPSSTATSAADVSSGLTDALRHRTRPSMPPGPSRGVDQQTNDTSASSSYAAKISLWVYGFRVGFRKV